MYLYRSELQISSDIFLKAFYWRRAVGSHPFELLMICSFNIEEVKVIRCKIPEFIAYSQIDLSLNLSSNVNDTVSIAAAIAVAYYPFFGCNKVELTCNY